MPNWATEGCKRPHATKGVPAAAFVRIRLPEIYDQLRPGAHTGARGGARNPLQTSSSPLSPGRRGGATAQSALGWYRPSVGVPETLDGRPSGVLV
eukprot:scaffold117829_cov47-Phaeocystis_antarctica.AAC.3